MVFRPPATRAATVHTSSTELPSRINPKLCKGCGIRFVPRRPDMVFHTGTCYSLWYRATHNKPRSPQVKNCKQCGVRFVTRNPSKKFDSRLCHDRWLRAHSNAKSYVLRRSPGVKPGKRCLWCGVSFRPYRASQQFHAGACGSRWRSAQKSALRPQRFKNCKQCGKRFLVSHAVQMFDTLRCGKLWRRLHSNVPSNTVEYSSYTHAKQRCSNGAACWKDYGARGIQFKYTSFQEFLDDVGPRPSPKHSINRKNNNGHYMPGNCNWATRLEQNRNRRRSFRIEYRKAA
jgi:hypothetical protein